jgi:hypothetical protein
MLAPVLLQSTAYRPHLPSSGGMPATRSIWPIHDPNHHYWDVALKPQKVMALRLRRRAIVLRPA